MTSVALGEMPLGGGLNAAGIRREVLEETVLRAFRRLSRGDSSRRQGSRDGIVDSGRYEIGDISGLMKTADGLMPVVVDAEMVMNIYKEEKLAAFRSVKSKNLLSIQLIK